MRLLADFSPFYIFLAFAAIAVVVMIAGFYQAKKRREALTRVAAELGLQFSPDAGPGLYHQYAAGDFDPFGQGSSRRAYNLVFGQRGDAYWEIFDYRYTTGSGKNRRTHHYGILAAKVPIGFPPTRIRPEGVFDKLKGFMGFEDINFESEAFSRRYHVYCADRQKAYDLIHPQMIEFLMSIPAIDWQLHGPVVLIARAGTYGPAEIPRVLGAVEQFLALIPQYLRQDLARP